MLAAYRTGFASSLDHLALIAAVVAFVGAVGGFALVRQRDFVPSTAPEEAPAARDEPAEAGAAA